MAADIHKATLIDFIKYDLAKGKGITHLAESDDLVDSDIMDSLGIMKLILFLETTYPVKIADEDLTLENFSSIDTIYSFLLSKM